MELYIRILKLFFRKALYISYNSYLDYEFLKKNYVELFRLFKVVELLHEGKPDEFVADASLVEAVLLTEYPGSSLDVYSPVFEKLASLPTEDSSGEIVKYLDSLRKRAKASEIAFAALDYAEGKTSEEALRAAVTSYASEEASGSDSSLVEDEGLVSDDIEVLLQSAYNGKGLRWRLGSLNRSLGPLRKGDFGFIFARPETGKTTFLASEATFMASQADGPVLWFNNEEQGDKVVLRLYEATLGASLETVMAHKKRARETFYERTKKNIKFFDRPGFSRRYAEQLCQKHKPALILFDQLDKVQGFDSDRDDLRLGKIYGWAREMAKIHGCPVIGVSQADGTAEGIKRLNMGHVANAKTAKQAEADFIIGIGRDFRDVPALRGISICKNKLLGSEESRPEMRHAQFDVLLEGEIARYKDTSE